MATRPVFIPCFQGNRLVEVKDISFKWFPGMSIVQKQKSIISFHEAIINTLHIKNILEVSSKSINDLGIKLSAFNLYINISNDISGSVEAIFQGSKMFQFGGPFFDIYNKTSREAKQDVRLKNSGRLVEFVLNGYSWPLVPPTVFYDWIYLNALCQNIELANNSLLYDCFTDIEFNPKSSINCQAYSCALYASLVKRGLFDKAILSPENFIHIISSFSGNKTPIQNTLI